jgi:hypothetical protein
MRKRTYVAHPESIDAIHCFPIVFVDGRRSYMGGDRVLRLLVPEMPEVDVEDVGPVDLIVLSARPQC